MNEVHVTSRAVTANASTTAQGKNSYTHMRAEILKRTYLKKNKDGKVTETEDQMYRRAANTIAAVEAKYGATETQVKAYADRFYQLMKNYKFLPNTPTLMNAGRPNSMLSACFVLPINDSIDEIFDTVKNTALIQKAGGGTGFCLDKLRPTGDIVRSSGGTTSGPMSFLRVLSGTTTAIQQGALRRGANMGMMSIGHPDILKFLHAKKDINTFGNFNLSVKVTGTFMKKLSEASESPHVVVNPRNKKRYLIPHSAIIDSYTIDDLVPASQANGDCYTVKEVWDLIITNAHASGEPGVCFIDRVNQDNPTPKLGRMEASNPCGEQYLLPFESCNLGSIDVSKFVRKDRADLDWRSLAKIVNLAVRFLDDVIDANHWPVAQIGKITLGNRKIGLGIMGFYDALVLLGIRYDSQQAVEFADKLAGFIQEHAHQASEQLAKERGTFPNWKDSVWDTKYHRQMRNAAVTTIAPTGTISLIASCSSGIEPIFSIASKRRVLEGEEFIVLHPLVERLGSEEGWLSERVRNLLIEGVPPIDIPEIPKKLQEVLLTAHEIRPEWHVKVQAAFQRSIDNAVSKSVNTPSSTSVEEVDQVYRLAFRLGCKGVTIYRDSSRQNQVITASGKRTLSLARPLIPRPRPYRTKGDTFKFHTGCGTLFVTVNKNDKGLCEVFANLGKAGGCAAQTEATCRAISISLRAGVDPGELIEQLKNIRCPSMVARRKTNKDITKLSCADAIAAAMEEAAGENCRPATTLPVNKCPNYGQPLRREEGCNVCDNCWSLKCG